MENVDAAAEGASKIGYPVMLKSTAGGGGIGMSICHSEQELRENYDRIKRLSENNFKNAGLFVETFVVWCCTAKEVLRWHENRINLIRATLYC